MQAADATGVDLSSIPTAINANTACIDCLAYHGLEDEIQELADRLAFLSDFRFIPSAPQSSSFRSAEAVIYPRSTPARCPDHCRRGGAHPHSVEATTSHCIRQVSKQKSSAAKLHHGELGGCSNFFPTLVSIHRDAATTLSFVNLLQAGALCFNLLIAFLQHLVVGLQY